MIYTVCDVETTGKSREMDNIVSFGYMRINSQFEVFQSGVLYFYHPSYILKEDAEQIHGLTENLLSQFREDFALNAKKMYALCYNSTIIGKNSNSFDIPFIKNFFKKFFFELPPIEINKGFDVQNNFTKIYRQRTGNKNIGTLSDYVACSDIDMEEVKRLRDGFKDPLNYSGKNKFHDAGMDVVYTYEIFKDTCKTLHLKP